VERTASRGGRGRRLEKKEWLHGTRVKTAEETKQLYELKLDVRNEERSTGRAGYLPASTQVATGFSEYNLESGDTYSDRGNVVSGSKLRTEIEIYADDRELAEKPPRRLM
jgi:hypothetical protein